MFKTKTYIDLYVRPNSTTEQRQNIINDWYRTELKKLIQPIVCRFCSMLTHHSIAIDLETNYIVEERPFYTTPDGPGKVIMDLLSKQA